MSGAGPAFAFARKPLAASRRPPSAAGRAFAYGCHTNESIASGVTFSM